MSGSRAAKAVKTILFTAQANDHHNSIKTKSLIKWLKSGHEVRVQINGKADKQRAMEDIYKTIESDVRSGARILQKVVKPENIKFTIRPTEAAASLMVDDSKETTDVDKEIESLVADQDVFSGDFEAQLSESIEKEMSKNKKKS